MEILFMGTAAAEGIPALFCQCDVCREAEKKGGKEIRTRASCLIDNALLVDFGPDIFMHKLKYNLDLAEIEHTIITHSHADHFTPIEMSYRHKMFATINNDKILNVYGNAHVSNEFNKIYGHRESYKNQLKFNDIKSFETFNAGGYEITPLKALHKRDEECFVYHIKKDGKAILYGNDSGIFPQETLDWLTGKELDLVIYDCTCALKKDGNNHMGLEDDVILDNELRKRGCITDKTKRVITHFSHNGGATHERLLQEGEKHGFIVAFDGMKLEV